MVIPINMSAVFSIMLCDSTIMCVCTCAGVSVCLLMNVWENVNESVKAFESIFKYRSSLLRQWLESQWNALTLHTLHTVLLMINWWGWSSLPGLFIISTVCASIRTECTIIWARKSVYGAGNDRQGLGMAQVGKGTHLIRTRRKLNYSGQRLFVIVRF